VQNSPLETDENPYLDSIQIGIIFEIYCFWDLQNQTLAITAVCEFDKWNRRNTDKCYYVDLQHSERIIMP